MLVLLWFVKEMNEFIEYLKNNPFKGNQEQCGTGNNYWNADYWTIEVATCLDNIEEYKVPEKFIDNKFCDINRIKKDAKIKLSVKSILNKIKNESDSLLICEAGRGLDIFVSNTIKKWKKIYCYDHVNYKKYLNYFDNVEFIRSPTSVFDPEIVKEKCIMIMNHSIYRKLDKFKTDNIIHAIVDGVQRW